MILRFLVAVLLVIWTWPSGAFLREGWRAGPILAVACPLGTGLGDGCPANGLYYLPAVNSTTRPTAAQAGTFMRQSGQTWTVDHPQTFNVAGLDYAIGATQSVASLTDIAAFDTQPTGQNPASTKCVYMPATGATATFTANVSGTAMTVTGGVNPSIGNELVVATGISANVYIIANPSAGVYTLSSSASFTNGSTVVAADTYQLASWPAGWPSVNCSGDTQTDFTLSGWNFGATAYQGTPVGTHDCVNLIIIPHNTTSYTPNITLSNLNFTNGPTCAPLIGGVHYGLISAQSVTRAPLILQNINFNGRADDAGQCCLAPTNQGFLLATNAYEANITAKYMYMVDTSTAPFLLTFSTGNEPACSNGQSAPYNSPGYVFTNEFNYIDAGVKLYGGGHYEIATITGTGLLCAVYDDNNTVLWQSSATTESTSAFFFFVGTTGTLEYNEVKNNTIVTNLTGGKQYPELYDYANYTTSNANPNYVVYGSPGASCSTWSCGGFVTGQTLNGSPDVIGLQNNVSGNNWNAGCNGPGLTSLCPNSGNWPSIAPNVSETGTNVLVNNRVVSETAAEADHGATTFDASETAGATGSTGSPNVTVSACPANATGSQLSDTTASQFVGTIKTCSGTAAVLFANAAFAVTSGDALKFAAYAYGVMLWENNFIDGGASGTSANNIPQYWSANPTIVSTGYASGGGGGCAVAVTISGNVELRTGGAGSYPNVNLMTSSSGHC